MLRLWLALATVIPALITTITLVVTSNVAQNSPSKIQSVNAPTVDSSTSLPRLSLNRTRPSAAASTNATLRSAEANADTSLRNSNTPFARTDGYRPREEIYLADPSNYDQRVAIDANGNRVDNEYIVVLHETVGSVTSAINLFQVPHRNDDDQVSYHALIASDGTVIYVVPPEQRAFGAGNSAFLSSKGEESVTTNANFPSSVNNFAYHISLETPIDGQNNSNPTHSGYTESQYRSLAWLISRSTISEDRITTHKQVDRSASRADPRSFEPERLLMLLRQYRGQ